MAIILHRCRATFVRFDGHACWRVQKALDEQGIAYRVAKGPARRRKRDDLERISGQRSYPVIEFVDGNTYRAEAAEMARRIREGRLFEGPASG
jgi:glutathione S-transferase